MADQVQFILDKLVPTFTLALESDIFTNDEIKAIVKKTRDFEYVLKRRELTVSDFVTYIEYEINLEKLQRIRCNNRMQYATKEQKNNFYKLQANMIKHICYIYNRAVRRFSNENQLWLDYIGFLQGMKSYSLLNGVYGQALALNPKCEALWISAVLYEVNVNNNIHAARILYQTALRKNTTNEVLWLKYFEFEIWQASRVLERRRLLQLVGGDEEDHSNPNAVAGVIFNHAIQNFKKKNYSKNDRYDLTVALSMYTSASKLCSSQLLNQLEDSLKKSFSDEIDMWSYLIRNTMDGMNNPSKTVVDTVDDLNTLTARCLLYMNEYYHVYKTHSENASEKGCNTAFAEKCYRMIQLCKEILTKLLSRICALNFNSISSENNHVKLKHMSKRRRLACSVYHSDADSEQGQDMSETTPKKQKKSKANDDNMANIHQLCGEYDFFVASISELFKNMENMQQIILRYVHVLSQEEWRSILQHYHQIHSIDILSDPSKICKSDIKKSHAHGCDGWLMHIVSDVVSVDHTIYQINNLFEKVQPTTYKGTNLLNSLLAYCEIGDNHPTNEAVTSKDIADEHILHWFYVCIDRLLTMFSLSNKTPIVTNTTNTNSSTSNNDIVELINTICDLYALLDNTSVLTMDLLTKLCNLRRNNIELINILCYDNNGRGCLLFMNIVSKLLVANDTNVSISVLKFVQNNIKSNYLNESEQHPVASNTPKNRQDWCCMLLNYYILCSENEITHKLILNIHAFVIKCQLNSPQNWLDRSKNKKIVMNRYFLQVLNLVNMYYTPEHSNGNSNQKESKDKIGLKNVQKSVIKDAMKYDSDKSNVDFWEARLLEG